MPAQPWLTIVNPAAGGGRCGRRAPAALESLRRDGLALEVRHTCAPGDATRFAREGRAAGFDHFLCVGGDGTSFEVLNGLFPSSGARPTLGALPLGTGNSFLRDFGILTSDEALARLRAGATRAVDLIRADHAGGVLHYLNILSLGFSATVGALTNQRYKPLGAAGYGLAVLDGVLALRHPTFPVRLDARPDSRACTFLAFCNSRFTGGTMEMAPAASPSDGLLDVIRVGPLGRLALLRALPKLYAGTHVRLPEVEASTARRVEFEAGPATPVMVDGEVLPLELRALEVLPGALTLVA